MGIVQVSEKKAYKIFKWGMLTLGCILVLVGGFIMLSGGGGAPSISPDKIHISAPGLVYYADDNYYGMDVFQKDTSIMVNTSPIGASRRVTFTIFQGAECLSITPATQPGGIATITLKGDSKTPYKFGGIVRVLVKSDQVSEELRVRIVLPSDQVRFNFGLWDEGGSVAEVSAFNYFNQVYSDYPFIAEKSDYIFTSTLNVFGGLVDGKNFQASPRGVDYGIRLFGVPKDDPSPPSGLTSGQGFKNIYIPIEVLLQVMESPHANAYDTFRFMISAEYEGSHINFFELKIVK